MNPAAITRIYDFFTIIMFENSNSSGYYELYKDTKSGSLKSRKIFGLSSNSTKNPVQMKGGTANGNYPFINFKINSRLIISYFK